MNRVVLAMVALASVVTAHCAVVTRDNAQATYAAATEAGDIEVTFKECMANSLYTFYEVKLDGAVVNSAKHSDNIGPFLVKGKGWIGGNHLSDVGKKSAKGISVAVSVDGEPLDQGVRQGQVMEVDVVNELYLPDGSVFAIETVKYRVSGNTIEVWAQHDYQIQAAETVDRYYGMQSMFEGETEILAPGGKKYNKWLTFVPGGADNAIKILGYEAPKFSAFVEHSPTAYQASYMVREDLGKRGKVGAEDVVYIGNSYEKSYHKLIGNAKVNPGETTRWHGAYSWFKEPVADTFRIEADAPTFEYPACLGGEWAVLSIDAQGVVAQRPADGIVHPQADSQPPQYYNISGQRIAAPHPGHVCLKVSCGQASKITM